LTELSDNQANGSERNTPFWIIELVVAHNLPFFGYQIIPVCLLNSHCKRIGKIGGCELPNAKAKKTRNTAMPEKIISSAIITTLANLLNCLPFFSTMMVERISATKTISVLEDNSVDINISFPLFITISSNH